MISCDSQVVSWLETMVGFVGMPRRSQFLEYPLDIIQAQSKIFLSLECRAKLLGSKSLAIAAKMVASRERGLFRWTNQDTYIACVSLCQQFASSLAELRWSHHDRHAGLGNRLAQNFRLTHSVCVLRLATRMQSASLSLSLSPYDIQRNHKICLSVCVYLCVYRRSNAS